MPPRFTLGLEEEFQLVDRASGQLSPRIEAGLARGQAVFGEQLKPELHPSIGELISPILPDIQAARSEMDVLRAKLARLVAQEGWAPPSVLSDPGVSRL